MPLSSLARQRVQYITGSLILVVLLMARGSGLAKQAVDVSTATGHKIEIDSIEGTAMIEGEAVVATTTATIKADHIQINTSTKRAKAKGHVVINQSSGTLQGDEADYNWESSTGVLRNAMGMSPPWRFSADQLIQKAPGIFVTRGGSLTSCDADPPHFHIASSRSQVEVGKRAKLKNAHLVAGEIPIFWSPFYTRSLISKKYSLRMEPGQTSRDGITNRTIWGYPFSQNSYTKLRWDYLQRTGNGGGMEHQYFSPNVKGGLDSYYVRDINPDPLPQSRRYSVLWNHYQRISTALTLNAKMDFKSDQTFGNQFQRVGNQIRVENQARGILSEAGLTYQFPKTSLQAQFDRQDKFDSTVSSSSFIGKITLPRLIFNTVPLSSKYLPFYTSFSGRFVNETLTRNNPEQTLRYQRSTNVGAQIRRDLRIRKSLTITPLLGYDQFWQDRDLNSATSEKDVYIGKYVGGGNVRQRLSRSVDLNLNYAYKGRFRRNQTVLDTLANDRGIEENFLNTSIDSYVGRNSRVTLSSGYDLRNSPRDLPTKYTHSSERFISPTLDIQMELRRNVQLYFRETYGLFDASKRVPIRTPVNTSGELQVGQATGNTLFSQGFSYAKTAFGQKPELILTNKLRFYLTPKWYVDGFISYRTVAEKKIDYRKIFPVERTVRVARDLHCWVLRMEFSRRPGISEASFYIDLKSNLSSHRNLFSKHPDTPFYPSREPPTDVSKVFPDPGTAN